MLFIILALFILIHILIGVYDFSFYRIPNLLLGALLVLFGLYAPLYLDFSMMMNSLVVFAVMFVISFTLYTFKIIGAGDAKYVTTASIWFGFHKIVPFLFFVSLAGGVLAIIYLVFRDHVGRLSDWIWMKIQKAEALQPRLQNVWIGSGTGPEKGKRENIGPRMIPYGVAIAVGSIITLMISPITHL